jgi:hypothetical protein
MHSTELAVPFVFEQSGVVATSSHDPSVLHFCPAVQSLETAGEAASSVHVQAYVCTVSDAQSKCVGHVLVVLLQ